MNEGLDVEKKATIGVAIGVVCAAGVIAAGIATFARLGKGRCRL